MSTKCAMILLALTCATCLAQSPPGETCVLLIGGLSKDPADLAAREQAMNALRGFLRVQMRVDPNRLVVLGAGDRASTADGIHQAIDSFKSVVRPQDRVICYYLGHANVVGDSVHLNLPGPDITQNELADWLQGIAAGRQVIVLDCPGAGLAAKALAAPGRMVVCAATAEQVYATRFTAHLTQVLGKRESDANGDGRLSLLEAFTATAREVEQWYRDQQILATETPCLEDNGDGTPSDRPWRYRTDGGDGANAAAFILTERP